jgi:hypothetical protein
MMQKSRQKVGVSGFQKWLLEFCAFACTVMNKGSKTQGDLPGLYLMSLMNKTA